MLMVYKVIKIFGDFQPVAALTVTLYAKLN